VPVAERETCFGFFARREITRIIEILSEFPYNMIESSAWL